MQHPEPADSARLIAQNLSRDHAIAAGPPIPLPILARGDGLSFWLAQARRRAADPPEDAAKAAEWLTDNDYILRRTLRALRSDMPQRFYSRLPRLTDHSSDGLPRVLVVARAALDALEMQPSLDALVAFVSAYQEGSELTISELWALPVMLRLSCLETLILASGEVFPGLDLPITARSDCSWSSNHDPTERIARSIMALTALAAIPWKDFFDRTSLVDAGLRRDPAGIYENMDFDSCDLYRKAVEKLARYSGQTETEVVQLALAKCRAPPAEARHQHVGYWLIGPGQPEMEAACNYRAPLPALAHRIVRSNAQLFYFGALLLFTCVALALPAALLWDHGAGAAWLTLGLLLSLVPAGIVAVTLVHWLITQILPPQILPKLDFEAGLPKGHQAAVAIPVIFRNTAEIAPLLELAETNWLTNPVAGLRFVILSDVADAETPERPDDAEIVEALRSGIDSLNARYPEHRPFVLLHRCRHFNKADGVWMGWERKRGKLTQFNDFLTSGDDAGFPVQAGEAARLVGTPHVITLDADTILPPGAAHRLLGTLAHPLNQPVFDEATDRVTEGYTFIQPRVEIAPEAGTRSLFTRFYTGDTSIDIYSRAVSDVYQDLFGEAVFTGKGAYHVAAFRRATAGRVPENAILSHDLFEGLHGRTALASDIVLYEDFPADYLGFARRSHRWIRGDWQLLPWLKRRVPGAGSEHLPSRFGLLDRWRIIDNLRRSLIPPGMVVFAAAGWLVLPGAAWLWTALTIAAPGAYLFTDLVAGLARGRRRGTVRGRLRLQRNNAGRWALAIVFMAHEAALALDAIGRALWRGYLSRRGMLDWTTAAHSRAHGTSGLWREMWAAPALALILTLLILTTNYAALPGAAPLLALWFFSPAIAARIARPPALSEAPLATTDRRFLRKIARRTWYFFEVFAGPHDNWLPPDNVQLEPGKEIAHRTSPTNIGMMMLSALSARDLGHETLRSFTLRARQLLDSMDRMERHRGHWLNWYDTRTLEPLEPRYVSTVDSGNLAVSLVSLAEGCREFADTPVLPASLWSGAVDTLDLLSESLERLPGAQGDRLRAEIAQIARRIENMGSLPSHAALLALQKEDFARLGPRLLELLAQSRSDPGTDFDEVRIWFERCAHHLQTVQAEIESLLPWMVLTDQAPDGQEALSRLIRDELGPDQPLLAAASRVETVCEAVAGARTGANAGPLDEKTALWLDQLDEALSTGLTAQEDLARELQGLATRATAAADGMDFAMLYDRERRIFHIGYNLAAGQLDPHYYDLLLSEARLASYFAIARRDVPAEHWFHLGRPISRVGGELTALSWNGSMFEYLMPALVLGTEEGRLLGRSERASVTIQQAYAARQGLPWGVSESGFALRDSAQVYQYQAFGVPGLGLKRGLEEDYVVAPYASGLALAVAPRAAVDNLRELERMGLCGVYGMFEAVDFTPARRPPGARLAPVVSHMAHHQGMLLAAIGNCLTDDALQRRFLADRRMRAVAMLLQERVPWDAPREPGRTDVTELPDLVRGAPVPDLGVWEPPRRFPPESLIMGNGRLSCTWTTAGAGSASWQGRALTRGLTHGPIEDNAAAIYLQDLDNGAIWRMGRGPGTKARFHAHMAEIQHREAGINATLEVCVAPRDDIEIRRINLVNTSGQPREIAVTSFAEPVLARTEDHERHPAFSKLFLAAEYLAEDRALIFSRRPRQAQDRPPVLLHRILGNTHKPAEVSFTTDRWTFLGRDGNPAQPSGLISGRGSGLDGRLGYSLDPVIALQGRLRLAPGEQCRLAFVTVAAASRETALDIARRYGDDAALGWAQDEARRAAAIEAAGLSLAQPDLALAQGLASRLMTGTDSLRQPRPALRDSLSGQPALWSMGLSGDLPIVVISKADDTPDAILTRMVQIHRWWHRRGFLVDLLVLRQGAAGYDEPVRQQLSAAMREAGVVEGLGERGGIHLRVSEQIGTAALQALQSAARVWIDGSSANLSEALREPPQDREPAPLFVPVTGPEPRALPEVDRPANLQFDNGLGGFTPEGDYMIHLSAGAKTPQPWCNVIANDSFGTVVTEAGGGFTWAGNSGENRLTPWSNDPVADPPGETLYLRDEETADIWSVTPEPCGDATACNVTHAPGVTEWQRTSRGLRKTLAVFVPPEAPVKLFVLEITNPGNHPRRLTATCYVEWVLGAVTELSRPHVICDYDPDSQALLARSGWNPEFAAHTAFLTSSHPPHSLSCDRRSFLGAEGRRDTPAALRSWDLGGRFSNVTDPCGAYQVHLDLAPGATERVVFALGQGEDPHDALRIARAWQDVDCADAARAAVAGLWDRRLGAVQVHTPDPAFDLMVNRWLLYQAFASRILARSGFHQSGGAYGFRDQLQDMLALLHVEPDRVRAHLLECAAHQFEEGDVLHWWHPPSGRGVRTRCSDDMLWLPYVTAEYVRATGDRAVLEEPIPFLAAPELRPEEHDRYAVFEAGTEVAPLLDHCLRALERGVTAGVRGLPLIAGGDWNDGMDGIGRHGRGESVWLGWFAAATADRFADLAEGAGREVVAELWRGRALQLRETADREGWDGDWYRRAFDDEGIPWGSTDNEECRIDSIAQSWSVLSGPDPNPRALRAMESLAEHLIDDEARLVRLLTPPFEKTPRDPGYIRAYPPGVRENGGQYSHAATWTGLAFAALGDGDTALRVFDIINPIRRADTPEKAALYRGEPYVLPGDVLGAAPHIGRAGWTWYTGAASWTWKLAVEGILGVRLIDGKLDLRPCLPSTWPKAELCLSLGEGIIHLTVKRQDTPVANGVELRVDGQPWTNGPIPFPPNGKKRHVEARTGPGFGSNEPD